MTRAVFFRLLVGWRLVAAGQLAAANWWFPRRWKLRPMSDLDLAMQEMNRVTMDYCMMHVG